MADNYKYDQAMAVAQRAGQEAEPINQDTIACIVCGEPAPIPDFDDGRPDHPPLCSEQCGVALAAQDTETESGA